MKLTENINRINSIMQLDKKILIETKSHDIVNNIFLNDPELSKIGTNDDYIKYLNTIFPNSLVSDIVYHGGTLNPSDRGKDSYTGIFGGKHGIYFTGSKLRAKSYMKGGNKEYQNRSQIFYAKINIQNPIPPKIWNKWKFGLDSISDNEYKIIKQNNYDGGIEKDRLSCININYCSQYVVFTKSQIHILGSNEDINMFKKYLLYGRDI